MTRQVKECKTLSTWMTGHGELQLDLEDTGDYVLRLYDSSLKMPWQLTDEIPMEPGVAQLVAAAIIEHIEANK